MMCRFTTIADRDWPCGPGPRLSAGVISNSIKATTVPQGALPALRLLLANQSGEVQQRPIRISWVPKGEDFSRQPLEVGIATEVHEGPRSEVPSEERRHARIEQRFSLVAYTEENRASSVLTHAGNILQ